MTAEDNYIFVSGDFYVVVFGCLGFWDSLFKLSLLALFTRLYPCLATPSRA
jgi:hypothetical protein